MRPLSTVDHGDGKWRREIGPTLESEEVMRSHERRRARLDGRPDLDYVLTDAELPGYYS